MVRKKLRENGKGVGLPYPMRSVGGVLVSLLGRMGA